MYRTASACDLAFSVSSITAAVVATGAMVLRQLFIVDRFFARQGHCTLAFQSLTSEGSVGDAALRKASQISGISEWQ